MPEINAAEIVKEAASSRQTPANFLGRFFPQRFARDLAEKTLPNKPLNQLSQADIVRLGTMLNDWQVRFRKTEGYDRAEVTLGGVSTDELSSQTMESKKVPGLYFIGEVVDVTGWLGGYNFQWAWASGFAAGSAI
jgi:predicted Rossmann fold flavoprotein